MATGLFNLKQVNQAISQGAWSGYIAPKWVEYLVVAGGGGGGYESNGGAGGGGGGGLLTGIVTVAAGTSYTVTVGAGGATSTSNTVVASNGAASVFGSISAAGGGGGGARVNGASGGSGGGGGDGTNSTSWAPGQGVSGQGNAGGRVTLSYQSAPGGGGAGTVGLSSVPSNTIGANGGAGIASSISGTVTTYAGGGGGGSGALGGCTAGTGGVGGGGNSGYNNGSTNFSPNAGGGNTGGGGGGTGNYTGYGAVAGAAGGSGIVVVRYPGNVQFYTGGTVTYSNGYIVHNFTSSGTLAPTTPTVVSEYQISRSLRFNAADSTFLTRTATANGSRTTATASLWVKRSVMGAEHRLMAFDSTGSGTIFWLFFNSSDQLQIYVAGAGTGLTTTQVFRDPSAWYHIVVGIDTTQNTSSDRIKLYVNGSQITAFTGTQTYYSQGASIQFNYTGYTTYFGYSNSNTLSGYMTEINWIDGQQLTPTSFGYVNPATGIWSPAKFVGAYGTNGVYLNFSDNSNTTAATLGKDSSGNGNNYTPTNFSVTAGAGNDSLVDSPTSYGTDTGVGGEVRGNYCTWNPLSNPSGTLSNGNLQIKGGTTRGVWTTFGLTSGKWYWEFNITSASVSNGPYFGISNYASTGQFGTVYALLRSANASYINNGCSVTGVGSGDITSGTVGVAIDVDAGTATLYHNNATRLTVSGIPAGTYYAYFCADAAADQFDLNAGQRPFAYTAPSGYKALCTQNLPTPTIGATTATQAGLYFNPVTYAGTGATQSVTVGFQPDWVWIKNRTNGANWHVLTDAVRGVQKEIYTNSTAAEATLTTTGVNQFNSSGFQILGGSGDYNRSGDNYVAWNWKANGSGSTNTAGSITSTVSANTTSGFSIVTYTGTGATATVGHGLNVAPSMIIVKARNSGSQNWVIYHASLGINYTMIFTTSAAISFANYWGAANPTTSVFGVANGAYDNNTSGTTYVGYCFAEVAGYSKFGSYTGNGSADGPFVYTGFRPAFVMTKRTDLTSDWTITDLRRPGYNLVNKSLYANQSSAELTYNVLDQVSNGFKLRDADGIWNGSGGTYIFMAFAENPFKYSLAR